MKKLVGTTIVAIISGIIINTLISCEKQDEPNQYKVEIHNNYFERLDSVYLGNVYFSEIESKEISPIKNVNAGLCLFKAKSESGLIFQAQVDLKGNNDNVILVFNEHGKLTR